MSATAVLAAAPPSKFSRYRSLRGKSVSEPRRKFDFETASFSDGAGSPKGPKGKILAVRPRRRSKSVATISFPKPPPMPLSAKDTNIVPIKQNGEVKATKPENKEATDAQDDGGVALAVTADMAVNPTALSSASPDLGREEQLLKEEEARRKREEEEAARWAAEVARLEAETDRILAEQKRKDLARLQAQLATVPPAPSLLSMKPKSPVLEKLAFFTRGRRSNAATLSPTSSATASVVDFSRANSLEPNLSPRTFVDQGWRAVVHLPDSPTPAIKNGGRQLGVICRGQRMSFPVLPDTSTVDILHSCSDLLKQSINTATSIVIESYQTLGLERRLRRYERIRNVMNSWDSDGQNSLIVLPSDTFESDRDLDISSVTRAGGPPTGFVLQLHHSQRPGKWNKRYITLLEDGKLYCSKKPTAGPNDKDCVPLCHLINYDIYTPTETQLRKHLKAPKKYCYALKSQQKMAAFVDRENFVQFFCTEDPSVAHTFHSIIHSWRSWYMVHQGLSVASTQPKDQEPAPKIPVVKHRPQKSVNIVKVNGGRLRVSCDQSPYSIGNFEPLLDLGRFDKPLDEFGKDWLPDRHSRLSMRPVDPENAPAPARPEKIIEEPTFAKDRSQDVGSDHIPGGQNNGENDGKVEHGGCVRGEGPSDKLQYQDNEMPAPPQHNSEPRPEPTSWFPSAIEHTARQRSASLKSAAAAPRPSTSHGTTHHERERALRRGHAHKVYRDASHPPPLSAAQWDHQHRFKSPPPPPPPGVHPLELAAHMHAKANAAAAAQNKFLEVPPRTILRRDTKGAMPAGNTVPLQHARPRAKSSASSQGGSVGVGSARHSHHGGGGGGGGGGGCGNSNEEQPPMPPLPGRDIVGDGGATSSVHVTRHLREQTSTPERGRDLKPKQLASGRLRGVSIHH